MRVIASFFYSAGSSLARAREKNARGHEQHCCRQARREFSLVMVPLSIAMRFRTNEAMTPQADPELEAVEGSAP
jgi:hypothetical protein